MRVPRRATISSAEKPLASKKAAASEAVMSGLGRFTSWALDTSPSLRPV